MYLYVIAISNNERFERILLNYNTVEVIEETDESYTCSGLIPTKGFTPIILRKEINQIVSNFELTYFITNDKTKIEKAIKDMYDSTQAKLDYYINKCETYKKINKERYSEVVKHI